MQVYGTEAIRNVALVSHNGAGKTSLTEALLFAAGGITRLGRVDDGNTTTDYEAEEIDRRSSIQTALAPCEWQGVKINVLDTPGYADFNGEVVSALAAADLAAEVVSAVDGVAVGTDVTWQQARDRGLPRVIIINKLDRENADFFKTLDVVKARFGRACVPVQLPQGAEASLSGVASLLTEAEAGKHPRGAEFREQLLEAAAEADDALTEAYLDKGTLTDDELAKGLRAGLLSGKLYPVLAASAAKQTGVKALLDFLSRFGPTPTERPPVQAKRGNDTVRLKADAAAPLAAQVFKTTADPYVGKLSFFRVFSGTLKSDAQVWNATRGQAERIGQLFVPKGKTQEPVASLAAGDIGAVAKLQYTATGDSICLKESPVIFPAIQFPSPVFSVAVAPRTKADLDKMGASLARLAEEDPSLRVTRDQDAGETLMSGLGDAQIDVAARKLKRKFGVDVIISAPRIPYRETITAKTQTEYKHRKQSGGHGQYGHVFLEFEPLPRGSGVQFETRVVGGSVPREYVPAVEKGVMEAVQSGVVAGYRVVDVRVTLTDGSSHAVDSSGMAFQIAAVQGVKKGLAQSNPVILEPVMHVAVTVPDAFTGDVMGDLNGKRGRVLGMNPQTGMTTIEADAPLSELQRYATDLRSLTQGRGYYTMTFARYDQLPAHLAQKLTAESKRVHA